MGCATEVVKLILFIFNLVFALSGLALLVVGVIYKLQLDDYTQYLDSHMNVAPTLLIVVGAIVFIIAFFGCCGAVRESHCMITTYAVLLLTIFLIEVALGVYIYLRSDGKNIDNAMKEEMTRVFQNYHKDPVAQRSIDTIQSSLRCCGINGPLDYSLTFGDLSVPPSCCIENTGSTCVIGIGKYWTDGCVEKLDHFKDTVARYIGIGAIVIASIEIIGIVFALCLANSIKNANRRMGV